MNVKELINHERDNLARYNNLKPLKETDSPKKKLFKQFYKDYNKLNSREKLYDIHPNIYSKMTKEIENNNLMPKTL